jgi:hypothetical protein
MPEALSSSSSTKLKNPKIMKLQQENTGKMLQHIGMGMGKDF